MLSKRSDTCSMRWRTRLLYFQAAADVGRPPPDKCMYRRGEHCPIWPGEPWPLSRVRSALRDGGLWSLGGHHGPFVCQGPRLLLGPYGRGPICLAGERGCVRVDSGSFPSAVGSGTRKHEENTQTPAPGADPVPRPLAPDISAATRRTRPWPRTAPSLRTPRSAHPRMPPPLPGGPRVRQSDSRNGERDRAGCIASLRLPAASSYARPVLSVSAQA